MQGVSFKSCTTCGDLLSATIGNFALHLGKLKADGTRYDSKLTNDCLVCLSGKALCRMESKMTETQLVVLNSHRQVKETGIKACSKCKGKFENTEKNFYFSRLGVLSPYCKGCNTIKCLPNNALRRAQIINAMPLWVDKEVLKAIYFNCPEGYEVDHVVPLKGKTVCGLHVPENLQYLPASINRRKSNKLDFQLGVN